MPTVTIEGGTLVAETDGDPTDPPVLLLHGLGADHGMWAPQIEPYTDAGLYLVVPDLRGHGDSTGAEGFTIEQCAADLGRLIDDLGISSTAVCGVSMGGTIAQRFAMDNPEAVSRLVLADTFSDVTGPIARLNARVAELGLSLLPGGWQWRLIESHYDAPEQDAIREYFRTMLFETDPSLVKRARRAVNRFDVRDDLDRIDAPTLVLVGEGNGGWFVDLARTTAAGIPDATLRVLTDASDPSNLTATRAFDRAVLEFLADHH